MKVDAGNGVNFFRMRIIPILAIALLAGACFRKTPAPAVVRPVKVATAAGAGLIDKDFAGMATPDDAVNLAFKVAGQVLDVPVSQGAGVKKGELLAELDPRDIELQVAATRSAFEETRSQQQRMQRLLEHEAVSRQEAEAAATRYAQARSTYENTLDLLKDTRLKAPFAGVVERKYVDNFERVQAGQPILRLVNPVTSTVQFTLPENALPLLRDSSTRFTVAFDNYRGAAIPARLKEYVETSSDASGFPVSLTLENPDPARYRISPGMSCTITMLSADPVPDAVSLSVSAVYAPAGGGTYVWIVGAGDRVMRREVTLGELFGRDRVVVDSGVAPGERVVTAGSSSSSRRRSSAPIRGPRRSRSRSLSLNPSNARCSRCAACIKSLRNPITGFRRYRSNWTRPHPPPKFRNCGTNCAARCSTSSRACPRGLRR